MARTTWPRTPFTPERPARPTRINRASRARTAGRTGRRLIPVARDQTPIARAVILAAQVPVADAGIQVPVEADQVLGVAITPVLIPAAQAPGRGRGNTGAGQGGPSARRGDYAGSDSRRTAPPPTVAVPILVAPNRAPIARAVTLVMVDRVADALRRARADAGPSARHGDYAGSDSRRAGPSADHAGGDSRRAGSSGDRPRVDSNTPLGPGRRGTTGASSWWTVRVRRGA